MVRKDVSNSKKLAALSPKTLALFLMLIPHFDNHGKMNGDPMYIKSEIVPFIPWLTILSIRKALTEIDRHTNVKWFQNEGRWYLHALSWREHQDLRADRLGADSLPSHPSVKVPDKSGRSPGVVPHEVEVEVQGEEEREVELEVRKAADASAGALRPPLARLPDNGNGNGVEEKGFPSRFLNFVEKLSLMKRDILLHALDLSSRGDKEAAIAHIKVAGFNGPELGRAKELLGMGREQ